MAQSSGICLPFEAIGILGRAAIALLSILSPECLLLPGCKCQGLAKSTQALPEQMVMSGLYGHVATCIGC